MQLHFRIFSGIMLLSAFFFFSCGNKKQHHFPLEKIREINAGMSTLQQGKGFDDQVIRIKPDRTAQPLTIWEGYDPQLWENAEYLVCEIWHDNPFSAVVNLEFYRDENSRDQIKSQSGSVVGDEKDRPRMTAKTGVLPGLRTKLVFPLKHLDAQEIFMQRYPRQLKGTVLGNRMEPGETTKLVIRFDPWKEPHFTPEFEIAAVYLTKNLPVPFPAVEKPVVDQFGQWTAREWPGKIQDINQLKERLNIQLNQAPVSLESETRSRYGGWKNKKLDATGFFRTHHDGTRWWLVDPDGYAFISVGVDCIRASAPGVITGQEDLFEWLPDTTDALYGNGYSKRGNQQMADFFQFNLMRAFGPSWKENWETITTGQIIQSGINTIGNWSDLEYARKAGIPYVLPLAGFPDTRIKLFRDFPDVFSEEYEKNAEVFARQLVEYKDDPWLIGYFLRNEPTWAFGAHDIAFEMFATNTSSESKNTFSRWLSTRYENVNALEKAWGITCGTFEGITEKTFEDYPSEQARQDFQAFSEILVARYVNIPCDEVEKTDPNHLNLGMRYAWISSDLLYKAGERFDVFSINGYGNPGPPETKEIARISGKPVMIGEFHFGATDAGLPATGIQGALSQNDRGTAYRYYVEQGIARPELIGIHYFQWLDQPVFGRFDGENYNIGFLDICNQPYRELNDAAKITHGIMYEVADKQIEPFGQIIEKIPSIYY